jgi:hypothetical protein
MSPSFTPGGYTEPGAYVQVKNVSLPNVQPGPRVGAITGTGKTTKNVLREEVTLTRASDVTPFIGTLANIPIVDLLADSSGYFYVTDAAGKKFYKTDDFTYVTSTGVITWRTTGPAPVNGFPEGTATGITTVTIYVDYTIDKTTLDYDAQYCTSLEQVVNLYGEADDDQDGVVEYTLPLGAQIFFENGGRQLYCVQTLPVTKVVVFDYTADPNVILAAHGLQNGDRIKFSNTGGALPTGLDNTTTYYVRDMASGSFNVALTSTGTAIALTGNGTGTSSFITQDNDILAAHTAAITKLESVSAYCVTPLFAANSTVNAALISTLKAHVTNMSAVTERKNRIGLLSGLSTTDDSTDKETSVSTHIAAIQACDYYRLGYIVPSNATKTLTYGTVTLSGPYIAAAVAGIVCNASYTAGEPISGKSLTGFDTVADIYTRYQKNRMASYGGFIIENSSGNYKVRHALSTDISDIVNAELKITRITDSVAYTTSSALEAMFINTRNTGAQTISDISSATRLILDSITSIQDIVSYQNLSVTQSSIDPRQIDVSFQIQPAWDINWILISFGVTL